MVTHVPMAVHPNAKKILIIGGGDGGVAKELIKYPFVEKIDVVETDKMFVDIPLQISCNVRRIIFLPVPVYIIKLGIRSFVDNFPYIVIFYNLFFTFFDICIGWDKMPVKFYTINLPHG